MTTPNSVPDAAARGFIRHDGTVFGWAIEHGTHVDYHMKYGTTDADFATRWRKWTKRSPVEVDSNLLDHEIAVYEFLIENGGCSNKMEDS